eukprot:GHVT01009300.1.p2 GENE.GHVT01009300.1~~GHVT01009300.1.p2  ORF type:complete len:108 (+),score=4.99 GHVT01009300.1:540-863(+)
MSCVLNDGKVSVGVRWYKLVFVYLMYFVHLVPVVRWVLFMLALGLFVSKFKSKDEKGVGGKLSEVGTLETAARGAVGVTWRPVLSLVRPATGAGAWKGKRSKERAQK